jgi:hypothetical protein
MVASVAILEKSPRPANPLATARKGRIEVQYAEETPTVHGENAQAMASTTQRIAGNTLLIARESVDWPWPLMRRRATARGVRRPASRRHGGGCCPRKARLRIALGGRTAKH